MTIRTALSVSVVGLALVAVLSAAPLPSGNSGIAARYPFDQASRPTLPSYLQTTSSPTAAPRG